MFHRVIVTTMSIIAGYASMIGFVGAASADAFDWSSVFQVHGYGTAGLVHSNQDQADYVVSYLTQGKGAGYSSSWSPEVDSKLALQLDAKFTSRLTAVVQVISQNAYINQWTSNPNSPYMPSLEWANIQYQLTADLSVRAGRIVLPFNMLSQFRNVGYAIPWVRTPIEVYGAVPFTNSDGMDATWRKHFGSWINTVVVHGGAESFRSPTNSSQSTMYGVNNTLERDALTLRASYMYSPVKLPVGIGVFDQFAQAAAGLPNDEGAAAAAQAQHFDDIYNLAHWTHLNHYGLGVMYDARDYFVMAEWALHETDNLFGSQNTAFASFGYRYQHWTPYLMYSAMRSIHGRQSPVPLQGLPAQLQQFGYVVNGIVAGITSSSISQHSWTTGLRWDAAQNFDAKLQYDYVKVDAHSTGLFNHVQPGFQPGGVSVISATVDFVF